MQGGNSSIEQDMERRRGSLHARSTLPWRAKSISDLISSICDSVKAIEGWLACFDGASGTRHCIVWSWRGLTAYTRTTPAQWPASVAFLEKGSKIVFASLNTITIFDIVSGQIENILEAVAVSTNKPNFAYFYLETWLSVDSWCTQKARYWTSVTNLTFSG